MRIIKRAVAFLISAVMLISAAISAGAVTVVKDGREYMLRSRTPTVGDINVLMIRLGFADYSADHAEDPADSEETLLSYFDGSQDSVNGFYETSSYGKLRLHCDSVYTYNAQYTRDDYDGEYARFTIDDLLDEALAALDEKIDYDAYDSDGDGYFDFLCFDFAGPMGNWAETWWPHVSYNGKASAGGKQATTYTLIRGDSHTFMHEFGHILGAADYYSYDRSLTDPLRTFDMMSSNDSDHCGFNKWLYGWLEEDDIAFVDRESGGMSVKLSPIESPLGGGKKIAVVAPSFSDDTRFLDEFFLVEYDSGEGNNKQVFEKYELEPGFRIFHVNAKAEYNDETGEAVFLKNNDAYRLNLIHSVKDENDDPALIGATERMFFREGDSLTPEGYPNTGFAAEAVYNGRFTGISFTDFVTGDEPSFKVSFSDEEIRQPDPELTLECESLDSEIRMSLTSDYPLVQKRKVADDYEAPYMIDPEGTKLILDISSRYGSATRFDIVYKNASPIVQPDTVYTLVIPEGYFISGYEQAVPEFRREIKTDSFIPLVPVERYSAEETGKRISNIFPVTDGSYGRIVLDARTAQCVFYEFNLNGEEIARDIFTAPEYHAGAKFLMGCKAYRLSDGAFAFCVYTLDNNYFTRIDRSGRMLSETFTLSDDAVKGYAGNVQEIEFVPFKNGLCKLLTGERFDSAILLTIDFERGAQISQADPNEVVIPLGSDHYIRKWYHDGSQHLHVFDSSDTQTADISTERLFLGAFLKDGKIGVLTRLIDYVDDKRVSTVHFETYDFSGNRLSDQDITENAGYLLDAFQLSGISVTESGYFLVASDDFSEKITVSACDSEWNKLGEFSFARNTDLIFTGECGLSAAYQYFEEEAEAARVVSRFNIGRFDLLPKRRILGDADGDGKVTILDGAYIQRYLADLEIPFEMDAATADTDGDGSVTVADATCIQKWLAALPTAHGIGNSIRED